MTASLARLPVPAVLLGAVAGGLSAGVLTSYLQGVLPGDWNLLADSGAVWTVVAVALALPCVHARWAAVTAGMLALLAEVAGYYAIALPLRGIASRPAERVLWTLAAVAMGAFAGTAAFEWRRGTDLARCTAAAAVGGVVLGEGLHQALRIAGDRPAGWVEVVAGLSVGVAGLVVAARTVRAGLAAAAVLTVMAVAVYVVYADPRLV